MTKDISTKPVKVEHASDTPAPAQPWSSLIPFKALRREIDRLFEDYDRGLWRTPFRSAWSLEPFFHGEIRWPATPTVDVSETEGEYKIKAELPGLNEENVEVTLANNVLTIKGEKAEEKEEKKPDYHVQERHFGAFERQFPIPDSVETAAIAATFKNGVLTVVLPKKAEAKKPEQKIEVKAA
jgi:HSP20 family protein